MTPPFLPLRLDWQPMSEPFGPVVELRLREILEQWEDTPYLSGQAVPGIGVYCTAFVARVLDELYRQPDTPLPSLPNDIGFHNRAGALAGLRYFMRRYPNHTEVDGWMVEPGDVLITGPANGGPGHAMIVGPDPETLWQADTGVGVHRSRFVLRASHRLHAVYRFFDRQKWS